MVKAARETPKADVQRITRVGTFVNLDKPAARAAAISFSEWLEARGVDVLMRRTHADALGRKGGVPDTTFFRQPDLIVCFGGDGTFLRVARALTRPRPALLGVNFGHLGYLTAVESHELEVFFEKLLAGPLPVEHRLRIACETSGWDDPPTALNDVVVQDAEGIRALTMRVHHGDRVIGEFRADGLIVATPTGSTAYTLSVGGPVIHPGVDAVLVALVSPHTLSARPIVLSTDEPVSVQVLTGRPIRVTIDGQETRELSSQAPIRVRRAPHDVAVVVDPARTFIDRLREKLTWGGRPPGNA